MSGRSKKKARAMHSSLPASPAGEMPEGKDFCPLKSESPAADLHDRWLVFGVCLFLAAIIWVVFGQTLRHEFVNFDDELYVSENPTVTGGLNLKGVEWAFTHIVVYNWHPLTMMSHMLDCRLYGLNSGGHHLTNILLHTATAILLFLVLRRMTGRLWRSAFVAAVFAIHPLRVESVAWVAERKDVLSGLFFILTLWAYVRYVRRPFSLGRYLLMVFLFALGLLSKPMVVTLPFVLLLLDYWPLNRFAPLTLAPVVTRNGDSLKNHSVLWRLILEKIPLLALIGAACVATIVAQKDIIVPVPLALRIGNAAVSYIVYLRQMLWPAALAVLYPYPQNGLPVWKITLAVVLLAAISSGVYLRRKKEPYLLIGWLWYLGMLIPAIGLVQSGLRAYADRYTYLPQIGLYLLLTWAAADLCTGWRHHRVVLGGGSTIVLTALIFCARTQTAYWQNSESLWTHTIACTPDNYVAHNDLGYALLQKGRVDEAITYFQKALQINPDYAEAHNNLGNILLKMGKVDEAITHYQKALQIKPDNAVIRNNLGNALLVMGKVDEAITHYQKTLQINPDYAEAHNSLGSALLQKGKMDEAMVHFQTALEINPDFAEAHNNLGNALFKMGKVDEAIVHYQKALQINPNDAEAQINLGSALLQKGSLDEAIAHYQKAVQNKPDSVDVLNNLAWLLATCPDAHVRDGVQAVKYAGRACELTHYGVTVFVGTLAAAYAEAGRYDDAMAAAQKACALATAAGERELLERNQKLLVLYRAHQPYHEAAGKVVPDAP
jgi:tetratricopeptide (TPR) repeat protein